MERSAEAVVAIHAVVQAGAAFVPLDPGYPPHRLQHITDDAGLRMVLDTLPIALTDIGSGAGPPTAPLPAPLPGLLLDAEAYVLYTSGSTGPAERRADHPPWAERVRRVRPRGLPRIGRAAGGGADLARCRST